MLVRPRVAWPCVAITVALALVTLSLAPNPALDLYLKLAQAVRTSLYWDATERVALLASAGWEDWSAADNIPSCCVPPRRAHLRPFRNRHWAEPTLRAAREATRQAPDAAGAARKIRLSKRQRLG